MNAMKRREMLEFRFPLPTLLGRILSDFLALVSRKRISARPSALQAALAAKSYGGRVFVRIRGGSGLFILDLAGEDIADQLAKLDGVARAGEAVRCHAGIMAWKAGRLKGRSSGPKIKLDHYRRAEALDRGETL